MKRAKLFPLAAVVVALLGGFDAEAAAVDAVAAETVAAHWAAAHRGGLGVVGAALSAVAERDADGALLWWTVPFTGGGAVFVAPDDRIEPVLFSTAKYTGALPARHPLRAMLTLDLRARLAALAARPAARLTARLGVSAQAAADPTAKYTAKWARLLADAKTAPALRSVQEDTLVNVVVCPGFEDGGALTHWNQGDDIYNFYTPYTPASEEEEGGEEEEESEDPPAPVEPPPADARSPCGCVATAMAAMLQYYNVTTMVANVKNTCTYNGASTNLVTIGGTNGYVWAALPSSYGGQAASEELTLEQKKILGRAAYDAGVCVKMGYTDNESSASVADVAAALKANFGFIHAEFVSGTRDNSTLSPDQCVDCIYSETMATNPVILAIRGFSGGDPTTTAGHAVCGVGYGEDADGTPYTRVFMGWGGACDGWYALPDPGIAYADESGIGGANNSDWPFIVGAVTRLRGPAETVFSARSIDAAIAAAQAAVPKKRILIVSGREAEPETQMLIGILAGRRAELEEQYVLFYSEQDGDYGLANPCVGVFDPDKLNAVEETRWADWGGRLAFEGFVVETDEGETKDITAERLMQALEATDEAWAAKISDCHLTVKGIYPTGTNGIVMTLFGPANLKQPYDYPVQYGGVSPAYGASAKNYAPGSKIELSAPAFVTNYAADALNDYDMGIGLVPGINDGVPDEIKGVVTNRVVFKCAGCIVDDGAGTVETNSSNVVNFAFKASTTNVVATWIWEPVLYAVETTAEWGAEDASHPGEAGTVTPEVAWYAPDDVVRLSAAPATDVPFGYWDYDDVLAFRYDDQDVEEKGSAFSFTMDQRPHYLAAFFEGKGEKTTYDVVNLSDEEAVKGVCAVANGGTALVWDEPTLLYAGPVSFLAPEQVTDATGGVWRCTGWTLAKGGETVDEGTDVLAGFDLDADAALTWHWEAVEVQQEIVLQWNHAHLTSATNAVVEGVSDPDLVTVETPEKGWKVTKNFDADNQRVTVSLAVDEEAFTPPALDIHADAENPDRLVVEAVIDPVVKWFWYAIYESADPAGPYVQTTTGDEAKAYPDDETPFTLRAVVTPGDEPRFYRVKISDEEPLDD